MLFASRCRWGPGHTWPLVNCLTAHERSAVVAATANRTDCSLCCGGSAPCTASMPLKRHCMFHHLLHSGL
jgi:hypothetical protein